jgi:hypothetical protein
VLPSLEFAQVVGDIWIFRGQRFEIADFDVDCLYSWPFCARAEEPTPLSDHPRSVESVARNEKLHALAGAKIWTDYGALGCSIFMQHKNFNRITQITVIELIVANAMERHGRIRRDHKVEGGASWSPIEEWRREPAWRNSLVADKRDAHETARGMRFELEQRTNFFGCEIIAHWFFLNM